MPDSFFQSNKKRTRPTGRSGASSSSSKPYEKPYRPAMYGKGQKPSSTSKAGLRDETLGSDDEGGAGMDLDDMDFRRDDLGEDGGVLSEQSEDEGETPAEKRIRLAKGYLARVANEIRPDDGGFDAEEIDRELIASRLQQDVAEAEGTIHLYIASTLSHTPRTHFLPTPSHLPTSTVLSHTSLFTSTKRGSIIRHSLPSLHKASQSFGQAGIAGAGPKRGDKLDNGHNGEILCLAASEDGKYLVSGGRDKVIGVWDVSGDEAVWVRGMQGHKDAVTSLSLPPLSNTSYHLLTTSLSRHLTLHSLSTLSILDTFFGHQDSIPSVSALKPTNCVTAGARDRTVRWWRVEEEVQLVFRGGGKTFEGVEGKEEPEEGERLGGGWKEGQEPKPKGKGMGKGKGREFVEGSVETVCMLDDQHFLSGGDSGSISLWHTGKKKAIYTQALAHGLAQSEGGISSPRWITSLAALRGTDLFASGSSDGFIRLWALSKPTKSFMPLFSVPVSGFVNSLQILALPLGSLELQLTAEQEQEQGTEEKGGKGTGKKQIVLVASVGQEPRLGRWERLKDAKNGALVVELITA